MKLKFAMFSNEFLPYFDDLRVVFISAKYLAEGYTIELQQQRKIDSVIPPEIYSDRFGNLREKVLYSYFEDLVSGHVTKFFNLYNQGKIVVKGENHAIESFKNFLATFNYQQKLAPKSLSMMFADQAPPKIDENTEEKALNYKK